MDEPLTILVAARDEEEGIAQTVTALRRGFPDAEVIVADDGSRDRTADVAEHAGAIVLRLPRRGKGQALSAAERAAPPGRLLLCDADLDGDLAPLTAGESDLEVAAFVDAGPLRVHVAYPRRCQAHRGRSCHDRPVRRRRTITSSSRRSRRAP